MGTRLEDPIHISYVRLMVTLFNSVCTKNSVLYSAQLFRDIGLLTCPLAAHEYVVTKALARYRIGGQFYEWAETMKTAYLWEVSVPGPAVWDRYLLLPTDRSRSHTFLGRPRSFLPLLDEHPRPPVSCTVKPAVI